MENAKPASLGPSQEEPGQKVMDYLHKHQVVNTLNDVVNNLVETFPEDPFGTMSFHLSGHAIPATFHGIVARPALSQPFPSLLTLELDIYVIHCKVLRLALRAPILSAYHLLDAANLLTNTVSTALRGIQLSDTLAVDQAISTCLSGMPLLISHVSLALLAAAALYQERPLSTLLQNLMPTHKNIPPQDSQSILPLLAIMENSSMLFYVSPEELDAQALATLATLSTALDEFSETSSPAGVLETNQNIHQIIELLSVHAPNMNIALQPKLAVHQFSCKDFMDIHEAHPNVNLLLDPFLPDDVASYNNLCGNLDTSFQIACSHAVSSDIESDKIRSISSFPSSPAVISLLVDSVSPAQAPLIFDAEGLFGDVAIEYSYFIGAKYLTFTPNHSTMWDSLGRL